MRGGKAAFDAEILKGDIGIHVEIARIGAHVSGNESGSIKSFGIAIFDRGDIGGLDPQFALHVEQGFAHGGPFAPHDIPKAQCEVVKPLWADVFLARRLAAPQFAPYHADLPRFSLP